MKVKNPLFWELPEISLTLELGGTTYRFSGVYDGHKSLPSKLLKMMAENQEKGGDKQNEI
ncbi:MAG: hypothetical protein LUF26_07030 [Firmicutes bacterium]|nr:hypothetical protein [Bacillota bacterium]MCD8390507.1 hypothetical protein [Bacillota bacterium]